MIVIDASVVVELLLNRPAGASLREQVLTTRQLLHAPHLIDLEVAQALRRYVRSGAMSEQRASLALEEMGGFRLTRHPHNIFLSRIWELRHNFTSYDAAYVALAEALPAPLLTLDKRMAAAPGHNAKIRLV